MPPARSLLLAWLGALAATEAALRIVAPAVHPDGLVALRSPGLVALVLALGAAGWAVSRALRRLPLARTVGAVTALALAVGAVRQLPRAVAADVQWGSDDVALAPVDRWRAEPRRWRALVAGECGITTVVEVERRGSGAVLTERDAFFPDGPFLFAYALGGWRRLPARRRAVRVYADDPGLHRPWEARDWVLIDGDGALWLAQR